MKFGQVEHPEKVDFKLPPDHPDTAKVLKGSSKAFEVFVGCAKWNKQDLKGFYPRGTKDELAYYSTQFNSIELNATFYKAPDRGQVETWKNKTPEDFKFFPKIPSTVSHYRRLINIEDPVEEFCDAISNFEDKLGMTFLQMHDNFKPKDFDRVEKFLENFPKAIPLALEVRNTEWISDKDVAEKLYDLLEKHNTTNVI